MNQPERDELRAKHHVGQNEAEDQCQACYSADGYPCDVIKVLDSWEAENDYWIQIENETLPEMEVNECDHYGIDSGGTDYYGTSNPPQEADWNYAYCPNCGRRL